MRIRHGLVTILALTSTVWLAGVSTDALAKETPFTVSANKRNIVFRDRPTDAFVLVSDTAWNLVQELSREQIKEYLDIRAAQGFTMVQFIATGHDFRPQRHYGWRPFDGKDFSKPEVVSGPDNDWWDYIEWILDELEKRHMYAGLLPMWRQDFHDGRIAGETACEAYGRFLGERFRDRNDRIIWFMGGDLPTGAFPLSWHRAVARGIAKWVSNGFEDYDAILASYHVAGRGNTLAFPANEPFMDFNTIQSGHMNRVKLLALLAGAILFTAGGAPLAIIPEYTVDEKGVHLKGIGAENPILYDNDWWNDVFDNNYLWAQASLGNADLRGNIVTRDMWDWDKDYLYPMQKCVENAEKALKRARQSGLKNIPDLTLGSDRVLTRPESGRIEDTVPHPTPGSRLIVAEAKRASPEKPLLIVAGGPQTTVANALLTNPEIATNLVVFNLTVSSYGYNGKDAWSAYIVAKRTRYVDWGGGRFWDRDSVFTAEHFAVLPDNPFTTDMKRLIQTNLGRANQLGDGAPLVRLFQPKCWTGVEIRAAEFRGRALEFLPVPPGGTGDLLVIPKAATDLRVCREEFSRVLTDPQLFP